MKKKDEIDPLIVTINDKPYLIFPEALDFVGGDRSVLHQRIIRGTVEGVEKRRKYVFVPMSYCEKMKKELEAKNTMKTLKEANADKLDVIQQIMEMDLTLEDLELIKKNKGLKNKK
jgi:hypothetical protein